MSHFISRLGVYFHFDRLVHHPVAREFTPFTDPSSPAGASSHATSGDDLAFLGLSGEHEALSPRSDLGQFALLSRDETDQAHVDALWASGP